MEADRFLNRGAWIRPAVVSAAVLAFVLTVAWRVLTFAGFQNDHFVHLARAQQILLGDLPIRDFVDPGMPLMYFTSAATWMLWGGSPGTELLLVSVAFAIGAALTVIVTHRLTGSIGLALIAALFEVLIAPRTYGYPKVLLYATAMCAIVAVVESPSRRRVLLASALTSVAFLFRHDHGVYIGIASAVTVALATVNLGWRTMTRRVVLFAAAAGFLIVPWLGFIAYHQGLVDYVRSGLEFSRAESTRNRGPLSFPPFRISSSDLVSLRPPYRPKATIEWTAGIPEATRRDLEARYGLEPVSTSGDLTREYYGPRLSPAEVRALADDPQVADATGLDRFTEWSDLDAWLARLSPWRLQVGSGWHVERNAYVWLLYVFYVLPIACAVIVWRRARRNAETWTGESAAIGSIAVLAVLVNVGLLRGNLSVWLPDAIAPAVILGAWMTPVVWRASWARRAGVRALVALVVVATLVAVALAGDVNTQIGRGGARSGVRGMAARFAELDSRVWGTHRKAGMTPSGVSNALLPFFDYLNRCTDRDDRLLMAQLYPDVFVLAERGFAGGHVAFLEGFYASPADQALTLARMRRESVPFVLFLRNREDLFRDNFDLLTTYIDSRYRLLAEIPVEQTDAVRVFVDTERAARGTDGQSGWPCFK